MFASYKLLPKTVKIDAESLHSNETLIVETKLSHLLNLYIDYQRYRVVQNRTRILRDTVARMVLQNDSPCLFAIFWAKVASAPIRHWAASSQCLKTFYNLHWRLQVQKKISFQIQLLATNASKFSVVIVLLFELKFTSKVNLCFITYFLVERVLQQW